MSEPLVDPHAVNVNDLAKRFRAMADRLELNAQSGFGGAFVVIPPAEGGNAIETLILDTMQDPAQFWSLLKTKCDINLAELDQVARNQQAFGRR